MKALYRKYRPKSLDEVVGQEQVTKVLSGSLASGKVNHAYLFIGPRGTGKTSVARIFAHQINDFKYELEDNYVDIVEIDGASNRGIDNIRELREKAMIAPTSGKYKVYIIDEVHMLTKEAFNALLKTLEEPPQHVVFIMATTDAYKVPVTITSRAQTYTFKLADKAVMLDFLKSVSEREGIKIADDALEIIVRRGGGSFRDSLSLLDQISTLSDTEITKELVASAMGLPESEKINSLLNSYEQGDTIEITKNLRELLASGIKPETLVEEMIQAIIEKPQPVMMPLLAKLPDVKEPFAEAKLLVCLVGQPTSTSAPMRRVTQAVSSATSTNIATSTSTVADTNVANNASTVAGTDAKANTDTATSTNTTTVQIEKVSVTQTTTNIQPPKEESEIHSETATKDGFTGWDAYLAKIKSLNEVIHTQLTKSEHEIIGNTLHLYPKTKIIKNILTSKNNKQILVTNAGGLLVEVHEAGEHPRTIAKDEFLSKFSDIMGGEVTNEYGGYDPF